MENRVKELSKFNTIYNNSNKKLKNDISKTTIVKYTVSLENKYSEMLIMHGSSCNAK